MSVAADTISGLHEPLALQLCSTCAISGSCRLGALESTLYRDAEERSFLLTAGRVTGCSWHLRADTPPIGEGLVGWYPASDFLTAAEIVALGSFRLDSEVCPICRRRPATDGAHAVRKKSGGRRRRLDGLQLELCRPCHTLLDDGADQTLGVTIPRYHETGFAVVLIERLDQSQYRTRELRSLAGSVALDAGQWKRIA